MMEMRQLVIYVQLILSVTVSLMAMIRMWS